LEAFVRAQFEKETLVKKDPPFKLSNLEALPPSTLTLVKKRSSIQTIKFGDPSTFHIDPGKKRSSIQTIKFGGPSAFHIDPGKKKILHSNYQIWRPFHLPHIDPAETVLFFSSGWKTVACTLQR